MNAHSTPTPAAMVEPAKWCGHSPSRFDWQVMVYGGDCPRGHGPLPPMLVQFFKRARHGGSGYTLNGVIQRADDYAYANKRTHYSIRDTDGTVVHNGETKELVRMREWNRAHRRAAELRGVGA